MSFNQQFDQHGAWRREFALNLKMLAEWMRDHDLMNAAVEERLRQLESQVRADKVIDSFQSGAGSVVAYNFMGQAFICCNSGSPTGGNDNWIWFHIPVGYLFAIGNPRADLLAPEIVGEAVGAFVGQQIGEIVVPEPQAAGSP